MSDLLPNDAPITQEQEAKEQAERGKIKEAYPLLEEVIKWFEVQAQQTEKIENINPDSNIPVEAQVIAMRELAALLRNKGNDLSILVETYIKNRKK